MRKVEADWQIDECLIRMDELNFQMNVLESEKKNLTEKIKGFMGENDTLLDSYGRVSVTWKGGKPVKRFDLESFKRERPEEYARYIKMHPQPRKFLIKRQ